MYGPRPIRFSAQWCVDYSKYRGFLAGGISTASSLLPFFGTRLRRPNFNLAPTQYRQLRRLTLREGEGRLWTEGLGTPRQAGCILKDQHLGSIGWSRDRQLSVHTSAFPEQANKTEHYPLLLKTKVLSANVARQYV